MIKLVVFDLDGTLINSIEDLADAVNNSLRDMGYPIHTLDKFNHFVGDGVIKLCERALPDDAKEHTEELRGRFSEYYAKNSTNKTRPYDDIEDMLTQLKSNGIKLAVASNKPHNFSVSIVEHFFGNTFDTILGNAPERPKKPSPEIIYDIMKIAGVSADETIMVGDSDVDIITAKNAGIKSIGCVWGYRGKAELQQAGADFIAKYPNDIADIVLKTS